MSSRTTQVMCSVVQKVPFSAEEWYLGTFDSKSTIGGTILALNVTSMPTVPPSFFSQAKAHFDRCSGCADSLCATASIGSAVSDAADHGMDKKRSVSGPDEVQSHDIGR